MVEQRKRLGCHRSHYGATMIALWLLGCVGTQESSGNMPSMSREFIPMEEVVDTNPDPNIVEISLQAARKEHRIVDAEHEYIFDGYAYNDSLPGPLIRIEKGMQLIVNFENQLDMGTTIHWHGLKTSEAMDGVPWMVGPIASGSSFVYAHEDMPSGLFWYHPHFDTEHQVDLGLYGMLLVTDPQQPPVDTEIALMLDDWPVAQEHEQHSAFYQEGIWTVNGVVEPDIAISGSTLLHMVNASNHHYLDLSVDGGRWVQNDQGMLSAPQERMVLAPGDRGSLLVERDVGRIAVWKHPFSAHGGMAWGDPTPIFWLDNDSVADPVSWPFSQDAPSHDSGQTDLVYVFHGDPYTDTWLINGEVFPDITIQSLSLGQHAIIELRNVSAVHHPFHLHGLTFEVLSIDGVAPSTRQIEDTIDMGIYQTTRILVHADNPGDWMLHCHILPHGDEGMMTVLRVE